MSERYLEYKMPVSKSYTDANNNMKEAELKEDYFECKTKNNSVVIIGANGSGKSKLAAWMEKQNTDGIHRISGQRDLNFNSSITAKAYDVAIKEFFYNNNIDNINDHIRYGTDMKELKRSKWNHGKETTTLITDFDRGLTAIASLYHKELEEFHERVRNKDDTVINSITNIWHKIFPQRNIELSTLYLKTSLKNSEQSYPSSEMSDGERAALYLMIQVLSIEEGKTIIIDEPEIHLHGSIMNNLWDELEKSRPNNLFIYLTHDTDFAGNKIESDTYWIKSYDGESWDYEKIMNNKLPHDLLLEILGANKKVLFIEGTESSLDSRLYKELFPDFLIVECGSCEQVKIKTKAFSEEDLLSNIECFGLIDRDYRSEEEIKNLSEDKIFTLEVAEVENLFLVEEIIKFYRNLVKNDSDIIESKKAVIQEFNKEIENQIQNAINYELKHIISNIDFVIEGDDLKVKENSQLIELEDYLKNKINKIKKEKETIYNTNDYNEIIKIANMKNLVHKVGDTFDLKNNAYVETILSKLKRGELKSVSTIKDGMKNYIPEPLKQEVK